MSHTPNTPRSRSRSKRSTTNLANLRLAPLSAKFADPPEQTAKSPKTPTAKSPYEESPDILFARQHSSYIQGRSAPTTPGILSRSSSKRHFGGGLSSKDHEYDQGDKGDAEEDESYTYAYVPRNRVSWDGARAEMGSGHIPKAKSEGVLFMQQKQQRLSGQGAHRHRRNLSHRSGAATPRNEPGYSRDDWLSHTGAMASAIVQEGKGQAWMANRASSTNIRPPDSSEDDDDDQYEEMAALSASTANLQLASFDGGSPVSTRVSRWGSRYGSRSQSRRTSRMTSPVGTRTPRRAADVQGYFDEYKPEITHEEPDFLDPKDRKDEYYQDQMEVERLTQTNSFGLGNLVDRIMNFNVFKVDEGHETTDDESAPPQLQVRENETQEEAQQRMHAEMKRRREEKEKLAAQPPPAPLGGGDDAPGDAGGWKDAAWLLSVASKAMF